jgi:DNA-binding MarR family transcriptional regulator
VSRAPDITRMLDKLEGRALIARTRSAEDRRSVLVTIAPAGLELVAKVAAPLRACHARQLGHLSADQLSTLTDLLQAARAPHETTETWK